MKYKKLLLFLILPVVALSLTACGVKVKGQQLTAVGSTALQPLVEAAAEDYSQTHSGIFVNVQGGGSGTGLSEIQQGAVDIGMSDLFAEEKRGIDTKQLQDHRLLVTGIAPVVNNKVKVENLTFKQLRDIFSGKITNWKKITGQNLPIVIVNRANGSGTRFNFEKIVLNGQTAKASQEQDSSGMTISIVSSTPGAISYVSFAYLKNSVLQPTVEGVRPTQKNVTTNKWKIWSYEHLYTRKNPNKTTVSFLNYLQSEKLTELIKSMKYIPTSQMKVERDVNGKVKKLAPELNHGSN
ncbi:phosphate ABC transporter substrate-binding protein PstS family protein [Xylocopilactobacillus apis]|uniref:Phosphate-binding protein n=1 Tax=Xylocopilactobacillus apis TaxID=2932183 RepID=A0AAU9D0J3_9LACO|nr:phosphate ABC transporter substrate-binding protein PstS family protein [Xylocopilactobacillus apis]BDR55805.1 phosphate-binding protein [Xylocopilactobacillus apis]